jgi:mycofactocin precursor
MTPRTDSLETSSPPSADVPATADQAADTAEAPDTVEVEQLLVEEVSIDGLCGVY